MDLTPVDRRVEAEVEVVQGSGFAEVGDFVTPGDGPLFAHVEFVLEDEFEELSVGEPVGFGFLQAHFQAAQQAGKPQGLGGLFEGIGHG
jgi:cold shock CspA family protein